MAEKSGLLIWLESIQDSDELARSLIEEGLWPDPELAGVVARGMIGDGEFSRRLQAIVGVRKTKPSRAQAKQKRQFDRIKKHHPALEQLSGPWRKPADEAPSEKSGLSDPGYELPPQLGWSPEERAKLALALQSLAVRDREFVKAWQADVRSRARSSGDENPFAPKPVAPAGAGLEMNPDSSAGPSGGLGHPFQAKPKRRPEMQSSLLTAGDAIRVFNGISFAMWKHGKVMNAHAIIVWSMIPNVDEEKAMEVLGLYLNEARKWLGVGGVPRRKIVADPRQGEQMHYVWVHENAPGRGFHSHILMHIPFDLRKRFKGWSRSCLVRLCNTHLPWKAFRVVPSYAKSLEQEVQGAWRWYRYVMKQLGPTEALRVDDSLAGVSAVGLREVLNPWGARTALPMPKMKRVGVSQSIGKGAQDAEGFFSMLNQGRFKELYTGREFDDRRTAQLMKGIDYPPWHSEFRSS